MRPEKSCFCSKVLLRVRNVFCSRFSAQKARITRVPVKFSRTVPRTPESAVCTPAKQRMPINIIAKTTMNSSGTVMTKIRAARVSTVNAIPTAPNTTKGERSNSLSVRFNPVCTCCVSLVMSVVMRLTPMRSHCAAEKQFR